MNPMTRRTWSGFRVTDAPAISAMPADGRMSVARMRRVVVFPAPLGPTSPKISPAIDGEVHAGDGDRPVVALDQALGADDGGHPMVPANSSSKLK